jgi:monothiol glutaredoxin
MNSSSKNLLTNLFPKRNCLNIKLNFLQIQNFKFGFNINKYTNNNTNTNNKIKIKIKTKTNNNLLFSNKFNFAEKEKEKSDEDSHSDFKPKSKVQITEDNVMEKIDEWVQNNKVVLFMKGTRQMPRCGFSNYTCQILKFYNIDDVKCINILEDNIVREAVKKYSNWPTYPQLYVKGNLIGN